MIKLNLADKITIEHIKDIALILVATFLIVLAAGQAKLEEENKVLKERYEQTKEINTLLIKENKELEKWKKVESN